MKAPRYYAIASRGPFFLARLDEGHVAGPFAVVTALTRNIVRAGMSADEALAVMRSWGLAWEPWVTLVFDRAEQWVQMGRKLATHPSADAKSS